MKIAHRHPSIIVAAASIAFIASASLLTLTAPRAVADQADEAGACHGLPSHAALQSALTAARHQMNGGFNLDMWGTVVNRDGVVCAVAFTGSDRGAQWPGSRVISAQKANTANAFSLPALALSTANLYSAVQPGGSLFGLQHSNPVDTEVAYRGPAIYFGQVNDPMVGHRIGGVNVFGGGLALYDASHTLLGAIGVSGDSSCADHNIAWRTRNALKLDHVPAGVSSDSLRADNIVYDITAASGEQEGVSASGWGHPVCSAEAKMIAATLPVTAP
ncbi:MAG: heme-binding protein [Gammaproteobacteria bacterium]|nr:heme-binding protein [Gammaproteobacteria bacterium]